MSSDLSPSHTIPNYPRNPTHPSIRLSIYSPSPPFNSTKSLTLPTPSPLALLLHFHHYLSQFLQRYRFTHKKIDPATICLPLALITSQPSHRHYNTCFPTLFLLQPPNLSRCLKPVHDRHTYVHKNNIRFHSRVLVGGYCM